MVCVGVIAEKLAKTLSRFRRSTILLIIINDSGESQSQHGMGSLRRYLPFERERPKTRALDAHGGVKWPLPKTRDEKNMALPNAGTLVFGDV